MNIPGEKALEFIEGFAGYGFNLAHATAYGILGYQSNWLKYYHPHEYMAAALETLANSSLRKEKEPKYIQECTRLGIKILPVDVNESKEDWCLVVNNGQKYIREGLTTLPGLGTKAAQEIVANQPFSSFEDFSDRCNGRPVTGLKTGLEDPKGVVKALLDSGALDIWIN